jgi:hypothetical protein
MSHLLIALAYRNEAFGTIVVTFAAKTKLTNPLPANMLKQVQSKKLRPPLAKRQAW